MLFTPDDLLTITVAIGVTVMFSKWLAEDDDDDTLLEVSILECLFIGGGGWGWTPCLLAMFDSETNYSLQSFTKTFQIDMAFHLNYYHHCNTIFIQIIFSRLKMS